MIQWVALTILTSFAVVLIAGPLIWKSAVRYSIAVFEAKVRRPSARTAEIGSSSHLDAVDDAQALDQTAEATPYQSKQIWTTAAVACGIVMLVSIGLFVLTRDQSIVVGTSLPNLSSLPAPAQPAAPSGRAQQIAGSAPSQDDALAALERFASSVPTPLSTPKPKSGLPPVDELMQRLNARLQKNSRDISGWRTLGWANFNTQHYDDAAAAYAKAIELFPNAADLYSARGEALAQAAKGTVTAESKQAFDEALRLDPKDLRARFFSGLAKAQAGERAAALDAWLAAANDAASNNPIYPTLRQHIAELAKELNIDVNQRLTKPIDAIKETPLPGSKSRDDGAMATAPLRNIDNLNTAQSPANPSNQSDMIGQMVERLSERLNKAPRDVDGWLMLMRSKLVLKDQPAAQEALVHALKVFDRPSPERDRLLAGAKSLGLNK